MFIDSMPVRWKTKIRFWRLRSQIAKIKRKKQYVCWPPPSGIYPCGYNIHPGSKVITFEIYASIPTQSWGLLDSISTKNSLLSVRCGPVSILLCRYWLLSLSLGLFVCLFVALWRPPFLLPVLFYRKTSLSRCAATTWQRFFLSRIGWKPHSLRPLATAKLTQKGGEFYLLSPRYLFPPRFHWVFVLFVV